MDKCGGPLSLFLLFTRGGGWGGVDVLITVLAGGCSVSQRPLPPWTTYGLSEARLTFKFSHFKLNVKVLGRGM